MRSILKIALSVFLLTTIGFGSTLVHAEEEDTQAFKNQMKWEAEVIAAGMRSNRPQKFQVWLDLAKNGNAVAQVELALWYEFGKSGEADFVKAATWYSRAAEQGYWNGQFGLAFLYERGFGVPQDYVLAYKWYNLAAAQGDTTSRDSREQISKKMTAQQITEAQSLTRTWQPKIE
jgi:TPR repeat protein